MSVRERAQAIQIGFGLLTLVTIGILYSMVSYVWPSLYGKLDAANESQHAAQGLTYVDQIFGNYLLVAILITTIGVIAVAIYQRQVVG